jgi:HEAT repeat protein
VQASRYRPTLLRQAAVSLGLMGDKRLVNDLVAMLAESRGLATQAATAAALGFIGDARSIEPLLEMLTNREKYTDTARGFAAVSLGLVADESALPWNATFASNINYRAVTPTLNDDAGAGLLNIL